MAIRELAASEMCHGCDPEQFSFRTTDDLEPLKEIIGQPRAVEAVRFGIDIQQEGYNVFALGPAGTGKQSLLWQFLEARVGQEPTPEDWCYVNNFEEPHRPKALSMPAGWGRQLRDEMNHLLDDVRGALASAFESDEYNQRRQVLEQRFAQHEQEALAQLQSRAREKRLEVMRTPEGIVIAPLGPDDKPLSPDQAERLPEPQRKQLESEVGKLQEEAQRLFEEAPRAAREARQQVRELNHKTAEQALGPLIEELRRKYHDLPKVLEHLEAVQADLVKNGEDLLKLHRAEQESPDVQGPFRLPVPHWLAGPPLLRRYQVNLLVDHDPAQGAPLVYEDHPNYSNVLGRVDHLVQMGLLVADFNLIKPGALHRANGGYLILEAHKLLAQPFVWEALKRAIRAREIRIESPGEALGLVRTVSLEPEPIPLKVKVTLMGSSLLYRLLRALDPDFPELFKVPADFAAQMDRSEADQQLYARLIATLVGKESLRPFDRGAVARVIEQSSRLAGDARKLSVHMRSVADLLHEADHWAGRDRSQHVRAQDVQRAIDSQTYRSDRLRERVQEEIQRGTILIDSQGAKVGQVNALAVIDLGDYMFAHPSRVTARASMGRGEVIDIEREVELGDPVHSKGVMILSGFLAGRYARKLPLSLSASLVFEQSYGAVGGDSASSAELYALISAIAEVPLKQSLAVTGSVNQHGQVQAIGAVNEKIEGFFEVCRARGLTGEQGVLIPASNVQHLMLRRDVVEAVSSGQFHVYAVETVDEGIELLTGVPAGQPDRQGHYPPESVNGRACARLEELARQRRKFGVQIKEPEPDQPV